MLTNEEILQKVITAADALAAGGKLNPEQSDKLLDFVFDQSVLKNMCRVAKIKAEQWELHKIGIGKRVIMLAAEAKDPGLRRGATASKIVLTPREIIVPVEISDLVKENCIEGESVVDHVLKMMGAQMANDLEEACLHADTLGPATLEGDIVDGGSTTQYVRDSILGAWDGWLRRSDLPAVDTGGVANQYPAAGANIGASIFSNAYQAMPTKFRRERANMRWIMSSDLIQKWLEKTSARATAAGDAALTSGNLQPIFGIKPLEVPLFDLQPRKVKHVTLPGTTAVTLGYTNIASGSEVVTATTLADTPTTKMIKDTDYAINYTTGMINRVGGAIGDGDTVKCTFRAGPEILLTHVQNFILGISRDIRVEMGRNIFKRVDQYVITTKIGMQVEEPSAIVKVKNLGTSV